MKHSCYAALSCMAASMIAGCAGPTVLSTPNSCSTLIPQSWRAGVPPVDLPADDSVGSWIAALDGQTGRLDLANGRTRDVMDIQEACEKRDALAVTKASKGWLGRLFD